VDVHAASGRLFKKGVQFDALDAVFADDGLPEGGVDDALDERSIVLDDLVPLHGLERLGKSGRIAGEQHESAGIEIQAVTQGNPRILEIPADEVDQRSTGNAFSRVNGETLTLFNEKQA
jgi:hypothetical protein